MSRQVQATAQTKQQAPTGSSVKGGILQRQCACGQHTVAGQECAECRQKHEGVMHRTAVSSAPVNTVPPIVHDVLSSPSRPLDADTRAFMEPRFNHDFSQVRVHTNAKAEESAWSVSALAYTVGRDVVFGAGQYAPSTPTGRRLLAHELTHTIQQRNALQPKSQDLTMTHPNDASEYEAESAANAILNDQRFTPTLSEGATIARQSDAGGGTPDAGTPDAGTSDAGAVAGSTPDAGTPDAGTPDAGVPGAGGGIAAPSPTINSVEVENSADSITYQVPSSAGAAGKSHWVTVASLAGPDAVVRANVSPAVPAADPSVAGLSWTVNGTPVAPADALHASIGRGAGKKVVRATLGGSSKELTIWAVFVNIASGGVVLDPPSIGGAPYLGRGTISFTGTIIPSAIIKDADRPDLSGPNTVTPPGGANDCGNPLAGGADHKWDMSRKIRQRVINPAGFAHPVDQADCFWDPIDFSPNDVVGNDDANVIGENNDPYATGGSITDFDLPSQLLPDGLGSDGDTLEFDLQFREFARLEYHGTWWRVSRFFPWRVTFRARNAGGRWIDNGTTASP